MARLLSDHGVQPRLPRHLSPLRARRARVGVHAHKAPRCGADCGLAYGFNPYRVVHLSHLELLAAYGMPAALAALHLFIRDRRPLGSERLRPPCSSRRCAPPTTCSSFQCSWRLWMLWFVRLREWRAAIEIVVACSAVAAVMAPIVLFGFWRIHQHYDFARPFQRSAVFYSADMTSLVPRSPLLPVWGGRQPQPAAGTAALSRADDYRARSSRAHDGDPAPPGDARRLALGLALAVARGVCLRDRRCVGRRTSGRGI